MKKFLQIFFSNRFLSILLPMIMTAALVVCCSFLYEILSDKEIYDMSVKNFLSTYESHLYVIIIYFFLFIASLIVFFIISINKANDRDLTTYADRLKKVVIQENDGEPVTNITTSVLEYETSDDKDLLDNHTSVQEIGTTKLNDNNEKINALELMLINLEDIKEFYTWSQKQAKAAFILAVVMCVLGFSLIAIAVIISAIFKLELQASLIPAIGGAISEIVAATALAVYKNSLTQLNHYHKALHEDERFLSSINLLSRFSSIDMQDNMLQEIIKSEIQMNLSELNSK